MKVKNYKEFACFDYIQNENSKDIRKLGQVVYKRTDFDEEDQDEVWYGKGFEEEIGVIIQVHEDGEYRTDMFGNCCSDELTVAKICEIKRLRPDLLSHIN